MSHGQTAGQSHNIKVANKFFESMAKVKHMGTVVTNEN